MAIKTEVLQFLSKWRPEAEQFIDFVPRQKNIEGMLKLGITKNMAKQMLCSLGVENYVSGPEMDRDRGKKDIWVFGIKCKGQDVYIKIKLYDRGGSWGAKCLSFHPADRPLRYPFSRGASI